ncbi:MAG: glycosyltransferase family protein [Candidatus Omnitrophota bacterium]
MKGAVIIQARMGASRLYGKVLMKLAEKTVLEHVIDRVRGTRSGWDVIVATTEKPDDEKIAELASEKGARVYRGSEEDVLDRYYRAALGYGVTDIVRITADCPVIDPSVIDRAVECYRSSGADYCSNVARPTFPDGQDVEVFSFKAVEKAWRNAVLLSEREHVTPYIRADRNGEFKIVSFENGTDLSAKRWTLDEKKDHEFLVKIFEGLYPYNPVFGMEEILAYLEDNPGLELINGGITRNEGYLKSLEMDNRKR